MGSFKRRSRARRFIGFLLRRWFFFAMVLVLGGLGVAARKGLQWLDAYTVRVQQFEEALSKQDFDKNPSAYIQASRELEIQRVEPMLYFLFGCIGLVLVTVLIVAIIKCISDQTRPAQDSTEWAREMRTRVAENRRKDGAK